MTRPELYYSIESEPAARLRKIEDELNDEEFVDAGREAVKISIAISLKRLADVAEWWQTSKMRNEI